MSDARSPSIEESILFLLLDYSEAGQGPLLNDFRFLISLVRKEIVVPLFFVVSIS